MKMVEILLLTVGTLLTELATDPRSSLSNGLTEWGGGDKEQINKYNVKGTTRNSFYVDFGVILLLLPVLPWTLASL